MPFCIDCGNKIPEKGKFCPQCGSKSFLAQEDVKQEPPTQLKPEKPEEYPQNDSHDIESPNEITFTLLNPGDSFAGYKIVKSLNKDIEGIKYVAQKPGSDDKLLLKIYHNYFFDRAEKLFTLQLRLNRLNKINETFIPKIVEINQANNPRFVVAKFIDGESLADIKHNNPERLTEDFVRKIAAQLIHATDVINANGLSINTLNLLGVMVDKQDNITILLSGISVEDDIDEREDIFTLGIILAQLLSRSGFYHTMYSESRLREHKFNFVSGTSVEFNRFLADCLHRNINQRFKSFNAMQNALDGLPPVSQCNIFTEKEGDIALDITPSESHKPGPKFDYLFWILIGFIAIIMGLLLTTNCKLPLPAVTSRKMP